MTTSTARPLVDDDLDWVVAALGRRRAALVPHAPVFWRPAPDAAARHREHLTHLLGDGGALGWRTDDAVLVAARLGDGWLVDDAAAPDDRWDDEGALLWEAFSGECRGSSVRFVCPTYETGRAAFARGVGLAVSESWWLRELDGPGGGGPGVRVALPGAAARTVAAPPVYAPPGPVLFLPGPVGDGRAVSAALGEAPGLGCSAVVVNQPAGGPGLLDVLRRAGFRRHCDYLTGTVA
ncbi:hypothetical protein [Nocardioides taihuensis]|uniref:GNAT family N-acetyltransferase n=1 Tax=Nocardioides taihuensis TaxID=1835606 RepID=A0ABW0BID1_9ACTN